MENAMDEERIRSIAAYYSEAYRDITIIENNDVSDHCSRRLHRMAFTTSQIRERWQCNGAGTKFKSSGIWKRLR
jgi:hypothetical protein